MLDLSKEPDLGYVFYPYESIEHPGHPRMDVIIQKTPMYRHFDPYSASFLVVSHTADKLEHINVRHPWTLGDKYRVCAGRIMVRDRTGKRVEAFSFGSDLEILSDEDRTVCALVSNAPIFSLYSVHDLPMWITAEVEIILARQKAQWDPNHPHSFEEHLVMLDPFLLYASCIKELQDRVHHSYIEEGELDHQGEHFIESEIQRLQENGQWPLLLPTPDELFRLRTERGNSYGLPE